MYELKHGFKIDIDKCNGMMHCMRACPTQALRVKNGKAKLIPELCIDCGSCLSVCPTKAISAATIKFSELDKFKFKVAVPSPVLFTQFGINDTPEDVCNALLNIGFNAVWDYAIDMELINRAIIDFIKKWKGPFPLISNICPVIVRLIQVLYPSMVENIIPIELPREIAARELKKRYSQELGLKPEEIAAIYISPCQAKTISILQPAEEAKSYLDGAVGISEIYNDIVYYLRKKEKSEIPNKNLLGFGGIFCWGIPERETHYFSPENYLPLIGLSDVIKVFNDIEMSKIRNIEYLECYACQGACVGGNLTVENLYIARSKNLRLIANASKFTPEYENEIARRYANEDFSLKASLKPRIIENSTNIHERLIIRKKVDTILKTLPMLNCGLCGAPSCKSHAQDVANLRAELGDCIFLSQERISVLKKLYLNKKD